MMRLTKREHGPAPSVREIAAHLGVSSTNGVSDHLYYMAKKGYISRAKGTCRSIRVLRYPVTLERDDGTKIRGEYMPVRS